MKNYRDIAASLIKRIIPATAAIALGWYALATASGGWSSVPRLLVGLSLFVVAAIIVASPLARLVAEPTGKLFYASEHFDRPQPLYSIAQAKRVRGLHEEALERYEEIAEEYPGETRPYEEMIDIAIMDLDDQDRALRIYELGMSRIKRHQDRDALTRMYRAIRSRSPKRQQ